MTHCGKNEIKGEGRGVRKEGGPNFWVHHPPPNSTALLACMISNFHRLSLTLSWLKNVETLSWSWYLSNDCLQASILTQCILNSGCIKISYQFFYFHPAWQGWKGKKRATRGYRLTWTRRNSWCHGKKF